MTKQKSTKRALLMSALSLLMCVSMLIGSTFAWFTDSVISGNNTIAAGNLDVELEYYNGAEWKTVNGATNLFDETLWEPGRTDVVYLRLKNIGSLALKYELAINIVSETPGINMAGEEFLLSDYIYMGVAEGQEPSFANRSAAQSAVASNAGIISEGYAADGEMVKGANDLYMAVVVYMPSSVDNAANYRGDTAPSIDLGINLIATQLMNEEDSFGNDYDEAAKYIISSDEEMIFNGTEFDTTVINNGTVDMINATIDTDKAGIQNHGNATLNDVEVKAGSSVDYAGISYAGSVTEYNNVNFDAAAGGIGIRDGAKVVFNSGKVNVGNASTSGRYCFYITGAGSELTINGGNFSFSNVSNKRAYIYADADTTVYVNGGTFGKPSTRSDYKAGIMGSGTVIITGGTFGFDPSAWVKTGYKAEKVGTNWVVVSAEVDVLVSDITALQTAIDAATADTTIAFATDITGNVVLTNGDITIDGRGYKLNGSVNLNGKQNVTLKGITFDAAGAQEAYDAYKGGTLRSYANIIGASKAANNGARNIVIDGCKFTGKFENAGAAIAFADRSRSTTMSGNVTVKNCTFNTENANYDVYGYYTGETGMTFTFEGNTFASECRGTSIYLGRLKTSEEIVVNGNAFEAKDSLENAVYVQGDTNYAPALDATGNTFAE